MSRIKNGKSPDLCNEKDCFEPRYQTGKKRYAKCETHMRALWRKYNTGSESDEPRARSLGRVKPAARKPAAPAVVVSVQKGGVCPVCHRAPQDAAFRALYHDSWCYTCTWIDTPRDELQRRLAPPIEPGCDSRSPNGSDLPVVVDASEDLRSQLDLATRELAVLRQAINQPQGDFKILLLDFQENVVRYLDGCQERSEAFPTGREAIIDLQVSAIRDGYVIARRHTADALGKFK